MKRDFYEVLGVTKNADAAAIQKAYRNLVKKYHPDTNADNPQAEEIFKEITEAYEILIDEDKRKLYDRFGHAAFDGTEGTYTDAGNSGFGGTWSGGRNQDRGGNGSRNRNNGSKGFAGGQYTQKGQDIPDLEFHNGMKQMNVSDWLI